MKYHSTNYSGGIEEFARMLVVSSSGASELLIVSPDKIDSLDGVVTKAFGAAVWKLLFKERKVHVAELGLTIFLEASRTKSAFKKGNVFLPMAAMHTVESAINDYRTVNTFYLPHSGPNTGYGIDELTVYLKKYRDSKEI